MSNPTKRPNQKSNPRMIMRPAKFEFEGDKVELHWNGDRLPGAYKRVNGALRRIKDRNKILRMVGFHFGSKDPKPTPVSDALTGGR